MKGEKESNVEEDIAEIQALLSEVESQLETTESKLNSNPEEILTLINEARPKLLRIKTLLDHLPSSDDEFLSKPSKRLSLIVARLESLRESLNEESSDGGIN